MDFLSSISLPQWAIIGIGVYVLLSGSMNITQLLAWFSKQFASKDKVVTVDQEYDLVDLVVRWDELNQSCKKAGCIQACKELEKVFPLLAPCCQTAGKMGETADES